VTSSEKPQKILLRLLVVSENTYFGQSNMLNYVIKVAWQYLAVTAQSQVQPVCCDCRHKNKLFASKGVSCNVPYPCINSGILCSWSISRSLPQTLKRRICPHRSQGKLGLHF